MLVVIDLENTISNSEHRMFMLKDYPKKEFDEKFIDDSVNENVKLFMDILYKRNCEIVVLTAKLWVYHSLVIEWLEKYKIMYHTLVMKQNAEIKDLDFKEEYVTKNKSNILFALDDVGANCAMFSKYDIPCLRIEQK